MDTAYIYIYTIYASLDLLLKNILINEPISNFRETKGKKIVFSVVL